MYAKGVGKRGKHVKRVNKSDNMRHVSLDFSEKTALTYISATKRDIFSAVFRCVFPFLVRQTATTFVVVFFDLNQKKRKKKLSAVSFVVYLVSFFVYYVSRIKKQKHLAFAQRKGKGK